MSQMGHYVIFFSIRCRLSNVDDFLFLSVTKNNLLA